jgi:hypothetical protein
LLPYGVLFNHDHKALTFQREWLLRHTVERVVNLADMSLYLFESAIRPALVVRYRKDPPENESGCIEYLVPKTKWETLRAELLLLSPEDRADIELRDVLPDLRRGEAPLVWKQRLWGTPRDWKLLDRLSLSPPLHDLVRQPNDRIEKRWLVAQGFQPEGKGDDPSESKDRTWPDSMLVLEARSQQIDLLVVERDCSKAGDRYRRLRQRSSTITDVYFAPHVLVTQGLRVAFADFDVAFRHAIQAFQGPAEDADLLMLLAAVLASPLADYFLFHTAANWGAERAKVHLAELLRMPFPLPEQTASPKDAWRIVKKIAVKMRKAIEETRKFFCTRGRRDLLFAGMPEPDEEARKRAAKRSKIIGRLRQQLTPLVYEYYEIDDLEKVLIEDTVSLIIPSSTPTGKGPIPTLDPCSSAERGEYLSLLCAQLNDWAKGGPFRVDGRVIASSRAGLGIVVLHRGKPSRKRKAEAQADEDSPQELLDVFKRISPLLREGGRTLVMARGLKVFHEASLYIPKPLARRFWSRTAALNDADEIATAILASETGERG